MATASHLELLRGMRLFFTAPGTGLSVILLHLLCVLRRDLFYCDVVSQKEIQMLQLF